MDRFRLRSALYCPFLLPVLSDRPWSDLADAQCRLPSGQMRLIPAAIARRLCTQGRHYDCPAYRFWRQSGRRGTRIA